MKSFPGSAVENFRDNPRYREAARSLLFAINEERAALENGNYVENPFYGKWGTLWCPVTAAWALAPAPVWASTSVGWFPPMAVGSAFQFATEIPESFRNGGYLTPTITFTFDAAPLATDVVQWTIAGSIAQRSGEFIPPVGFYGDYTASPSDLIRMCGMRLALPALTLNPGALLTYVIARAGAVTSVDPYLLGVSWSYQKQKFGMEERP